jgi:hypothetical protein
MAAGEVEVRIEEALDLASTYVFGTDPGRIPPVLAAAYDACTTEGDRARLAAALARCWAYAGERTRAVRFAVAAVTHAEAAGDPAVLADALDAALATHWGPDDFDVRVDLASRLGDVAAHVLDPDARLRAHLWLLSVAAESLDLRELNRQMRAIELLGEESRKAQFFAASRRLALDLMRGRTDTMARLLALVEETQDELPDGFLVLFALRAYGAVHVRAGLDSAGLERARDVAREGEALTERDGIREVFAEIAWVYLGLGLPDDARRLALTYDERSLARLPRDHNYLMVLQHLLDVALALDLDELVASIVPRLLPYAGRAVINAGFVAFHGVTDDTLSRGCARLGDLERAAALRQKALDTYRRIGATWWYERLAAWQPDLSDATSAAPPGAISMTLRPGPPGVWLVGRGSDESAIPARRGLEHLHVLLSNPGRDVPALTLAGGGAEQSALGPVLDDAALAAYRRRVAELDELLDAADASGDATKGAQLAAEKEALVAELSAATGRRGRQRVVGGDAERARVAVRKAITAAIDAVHSVDPVVARYLSTHVSTGMQCRYEPDPDQQVTWRL